MKRHGIVLLTTLFFIIAVTAVVAVSLTQVQKGTSRLGESRLLVQSSVTLEDLLAMLKQVNLDDANDSASFDAFLGTASFIPLQAKGFEGALKVASARGKININTLDREAFRTALISYLQQRYYVANPEYLVEMLLDSMEGIKEEGYRTTLFLDRPWLYRERIADMRHFRQILDAYARDQHDGSVYRVPWDALIRFDDHNSTALDANYVTPELWTMLVPQFASTEGAEHAFTDKPYASVGDLPLSSEELTALTRDFDLNVNQRVVDVSLRLDTPDDLQAVITFEYNMDNQEAGNFDYAI